MTLIKRGPHARQRRLETAKSRITIKIDTEVPEQFKELVPSGQGYQSLINHALREGLVAQAVKELVRAQLKEMTEQVVASIQRVIHHNMLVSTDILSAICYQRSAVVTQTKHMQQKILGGGHT